MYQETSYDKEGLQAHWMPFTANYDFKVDPRLIVKAKGCYLWNHRGDKILDGSSGLFCSALGHCRQEVIEAVTQQISELDYSSPFQLGHPKGFELAKKLSSILPGDINNVFFTNSGSEAIDSAIKLAIAYHRARKEGERTQLVTRQRAYHGVNLGGTALSGIMKNREQFNGICPPASLIRHTWNPNELFVKGQPQQGADLAEDLHVLANTIGGTNIAAVFVEPIAGSTGVLVPPKGYLERLREICDEHGILLIFDEVITAFGRTGKNFASESFNVLPDIMTLAKALTNATIPMGAVACRSHIYETLVEEQKKSTIEFFHGYTYSAHPVACAAGIATFDVMQKEKTTEKAAALSPYFLEKMYSLRDFSCIKDIRGYGLMAGIEFHAENGTVGVFGGKATKNLFKKGLHVKFTGDVAIVAPPFISDKSIVDEIYDIIYEECKSH